MIKIGEKVRRNPNYKGIKDFTKRKRWETYFTEVGVVIKIAADHSNDTWHPVVEFPSITAHYTEWKHSLIKLDKGQQQTLEEQGFEDELFEI